MALCLWLNGSTFPLETNICVLVSFIENNAFWHMYKFRGLFHHQAVSFSITSYISPFFSSVLKYLRLSLNKFHVYKNSLNSDHY